MDASKLKLIEENVFPGSLKLVLVDMVSIFKKGGVRRTRVPLLVSNPQLAPLRKARTQLHPDLSRVLRLAAFQPNSLLL